MYDIGIYCIQDVTPQVQQSILAPGSESVVNEQVERGCQFEIES